MGKAFPELVRAEALITEVLKLEETSFRRTLERGLRLLEEETAQLPAGAPLAGEVAFKLYDTYGFPLDLTQDALRGQGRTVDTRRLRHRHGAPARGRPRRLEGLGRRGGRADLVRPAREPGGHRVPGLRHHACRGRGHRAGRRRPAGRARRARPGHGGHQPDPVLRRIGRPDRRHRHHPLRRRRGRTSPTRKSGSATCSSMSAGSRAGRWRWATRSSSRPTPPAATASAAPTPPPTCCTRPCAGIWASTWRRRARWSPPTGCASTSASRGR